MRTVLFVLSLLAAAPAYAQNIFPPFVPPGPGDDIFAPAVATLEPSRVAQARPVTVPPVPVPPVVVPGPQGPMGPQGPAGPQGPEGPQGPQGPAWPRYRPHLDVLQHGYIVTATVPRASGIHDKLLYNPATKTAVLLDMRDGLEARCYQLLPNFHAHHTFSSITVDATRTFTWHDVTGLWTLDWPTVTCVPF